MRTDPAAPPKGCMMATFRPGWFLALTLIWAATPVPAAPRSAAADRLPEWIRSESAGSQPRRWTIADIVEVRQITDLAISAEGGRVAFIVRQSFTDDGNVRFGLYLIERTAPGLARKLLEASYLAEVSTHPASRSWTLRADVGAGVQLYDVDDRGRLKPLVVNPATGLVGTWLGLRAGLDLPHQTGVLSYQWAPDGSSLWYSRFRLRDPRARQSVENQGIVYDERLMTNLTPLNQPGLLVGTELRLVDARFHRDRLLAFIPTNAATDLGLFSRRWGTALWEPDSRHIRYMKVTTASDGTFITSYWRADTMTGDSDALPSSMALSAIDKIVTWPRQGCYLTVRTDHGHRRLVEIDENGAIVQDREETTMLWLQGDEQAWSDPATGRFIAGVHYPDHDGLISVPRSGPIVALAPNHDHLSSCSFAGNLKYGACVRETLATPPEIVSVSGLDGQTTTLVRPNSRYQAIERLRTEPATWVNRFAHQSTGYITYPREYRVGQRVPVVVVTHGRDAQNHFASQDFQWDFPVQVLAELGYVVLSVNEPQVSAEERALFGERISDAVASGAARAQFNLGRDAVATMEAAVQDIVSKGIGDPDKTAILGYSRGAEIVVYALSQSKVFKVGVTGDGGAPVEAYWMSRSARAWNRALYGGSPFDSDPTVMESYRGFSPSFRASQFSGPLLQITTAATALTGLELNGLLLEAAVPTELVYFPDESHLFWQPQRRAAAMSRTIDWLNYWLLAKREPDVAKQEQYQRWDALASAWTPRR